MSFSSVEFTRAPEVSAEFAGRVRGLLCASALGDALGYPLELLSADQIAACDPKPWDSAFGELLISDDTQLTCFTLDGLTEVWSGTMRARRRMSWRVCGWRICGGSAVLVRFCRTLRRFRWIVRLMGLRS